MLTFENVFCFVQKKHPFANRPLTDWIALRVCVPALLAGSIIGVLSLAVLPAWSVLLVVSAVMTFNCWKTSNLALNHFHIFMKQYDRNHEEDEVKLLLGKVPEGEDRFATQQHWTFSQNHENVELREIIEAESKTDFKALGMLTIAWTLVVICNLVKSTLPCGSTWFFCLALFPIPILFTISWRTGLHVIETHERKTQLGQKLGFEVFVTGEALWTRECVSSLGIVSFVAGAAAGSLGIAAALLIGPFLLQAGMNPMVAMASTGVTILIVSSATTLQFFFLGQLKKDYALLFMAASFLGGLLGNTLMNVGPPSTMNPKP